MKMLIAADIVGCTPAFQRFLAALGQFDADAGVLLGDLTGAALVPILQMGPSEWQTSIDEKTVRAESRTEVAALRDELERHGHYWLDVTAEEFEQTRQSPVLIDLLFKSAVRTRLESWLEAADSALGHSGVQLFMGPGCNDWPVIDDLLDNGHSTHPCEGLCVPLEGYDMVTVWSSEPADESVRQDTEEHLVAEIEELCSRARNARYVILNAHHRSRAVQRLVKKLQPMLYVYAANMSMGGFGGVTSIGRTVGLNPGLAASDDGNGAMRAALVELQHGQVKDCRHVSG